LAAKDTLIARHFAATSAHLAMTDGIRVGHQSVIRSVIVIYGVGVLASSILCSYEYASLLALYITHVEIIMSYSF
jgi:hypothetical protein